MKPPYHNKGPKKKEKWNQMGEWQSWNLEGQIIAKTSCGKGKGDILGAGKRTTKKRKCERFGFTNRIFVSGHPVVPCGPDEPLRPDPE